MHSSAVVFPDRFDLISALRPAATVGYHTRMRRIFRLFSLSSMFAAATAAPLAAQNSVLLVPDSGLNKVWAFSPFDGSIVSPDFIPADGLLAQPIQAIPSGTGTIIITDEVQKAVFEYSASGTYIRTLAAGLVNCYAACMKDGVAYVTSGFSQAGIGGLIYRVPLDGSQPTVFSDWTGIGDPRGILPYGDGFLVGNSIDDDLEIVGPTGGVAPFPLVNSDGVTNIDFPQQIHDIGGGNWMVVGFSRPSGIFFYDNEGVLYRTHQGELATIPRGAYLLGNGNILYTGGTRVEVLDTTTLVTTTVVNQAGTSFRWIDLYTPPANCPGDINLSGAVDASDIALLLSAWGTADQAADLDDDGIVAASDIAALLGAWGPCTP
jgi:hypothetical protein